MVVPSGSSNPIAGAQSMSPSLLRSNSGMLAAAQGGQMPLMSPRTQYTNNTMNVSSLLGQSFVNGVSNSEPDPINNSVGNGMSFNPSSSSFIQSNQIQGQHFSNPLDQQLESQNFQQQQYNTLRGSFGPVKIEPQNINSVKLEPHQIQPSRNTVPIKMEPQNSISEQSLFHQQQQQQQILQMSRQSSQATQMNFLQQPRFLQLPQHQQQQILKSIPQQRSLVPHQFSQSNLPSRSLAKPVFEPGMCARRLTHYMCQQQHRPEDNNIEFWRKYVAEYFAANAKKKWCVSMYGSGRQTTGVFPEDVWHCEICNHKPGRGFEATAEVLPRLFKIKYESGTLEELLYVDMPREYANTSGQYVLDYAKAIQESVFEQLRVVREGQLRIVFSPDLKICSWEFCARRHEELIPRRLLMPQVSQIAAAAKKYHTATTQNASSSLSAQELQNNCNMFVASARQLTKALEVQSVNDLGYTKRYVRCLQISEVVNCMKDLIDYSREKDIGPIDSLAKYPRRSIFHNRARQPEDQLQNHSQNSIIDQNSSSVSTMQQIMNSSNGINAINTLPVATSVATTAIANLLHQNSINSRHSNGFHNPNSNSAVAQFHNPNPNAAAGQFQSAGMGMGLGPDPVENESQSSVQKIIHEMMMSSQGNNGGSLGNDMKNVVMNGNGIGNGVGMNWRAGMSREQAGGADLMGGSGSVNGFNNLQFDWKSASP